MAKNLTPIQLTLYGEKDGISDEVIAEFRRSIIPWGILKRAVRFAKSVDLNNIEIDSLTEENIDEMAGIVAAVFSDQVTVEQLDQGADVMDMLAVIQEIMARAGSISNPTQRPGK